MTYNTILLNNYFRIQLKIFLSGLHPFILFLTLSMFATGIKGQPNLQNSSIPNFFLECYHCDDSYVMQELKFVSFVRNQDLADVHILLSESRTGSGGVKYFLTFLGNGSLEGQNVEFEYISGQSQTDDETRRGLLKIIQTGVLYYYSKLGLIQHIDISLDENSNIIKPENLDRDPWKSWIFTIDAGGNFEKEVSKNEFSINSEIEVEKVTPQWKTNFEMRYDTDHESYFDDDNKITNNQHEIELTGNYVKSLSSHLSAGIFSGYYSRTYYNIKSRYQLDAAAEYNIFPWSVSNRKIFTFRYQAGISKYDYNELTIYDKNNETLFHQAVSINLEMVQPWGNIETRIEYRNYFHDFSKNRLTFDSDFSIRLSKNFSVYSAFEINRVHDQLYLAKGDASMEDVLLERRKLATTYEMRGEIGLRYTFGSIYSSVVNERM